MRRPTATLIAAATCSAMALLVLAPAALAENDGRGAYGATNDKVVTNAGFIVIAFFTVFVIVMSRVQRRLEKRKQAGRAAAKQLGDAEWHGGW